MRGRSSLWDTYRAIALGPTLACDMDRRSSGRLVSRTSLTWWQLKDPKTKYKGLNWDMVRYVCSWWSYNWAFPYNWDFTINYILTLFWSVAAALEPTSGGMTRLIGTLACVSCTSLAGMTTCMFLQGHMPSLARSILVSCGP